MTTWAMRIYPSLLAACLCLAVVAAFAGYAHAQPPPKPLTKDEVVKLLGGNVPAKRVEALVRERGIDFQITPETESDLRKAGATDKLLAALHDLAPKSPPAPESPTLLIQSTPGGANVYVDDVPMGTTSAEGRLRLPTLLSGQHTVRVGLDGYSEYEQTVRLQSGQTASLSAVLQPSSPAPSQRGEATRNGSGNPTGLPVEFEVWHAHGYPAIHFAYGNLRVSNGGLGFREEGSHADAKHTFNLSCSEVKKAKKVRGSPWFHIQFRAENYNFVAGSYPDQPDGIKTQAILQAISSACGQSY